MNNMRRDRIKNSLQKDLYSSYEASNPPTTLLLGGDLKKMWQAKESSKLTSHPLFQLPRYAKHQNQKGGIQAKPKARYLLQNQNNRKYRN